ncbi:uncharacterized protein LOC132182662 isoform X1 [Corylus avellana]|uniref:uncharacterized protein LOC132182662 isoform X1 n=1 Tax=Corylus avellana TaxID=13451 RepID=UPI00286A1E62|nr:uncharacterized protein LOC132182662 isoform X1 [Corylus avellana]XP_059451961.1 uncharacterized protein LOC132182662 isoform X1 [Corylus avellana]XP_059451968.1 uncharacterized protein LOC132182662 isoform X1 [Corylus avellana]
MSLDPPPFQEAARCDVCKCSFNTFRRRHHCRCCGRTLCHEHSSNQMALPQLGIHSFVRVCADCYNDSSRSGKVDPQASLYGVDCATDRVSKLDIGTDINLEAGPTAEHDSVSIISECKCGMPLCICEAPSPSTHALPLQRNTTSNFTPQINPKPKKTETIPRNRGATSNNKLCSVFSLGQVANDDLNKPQMDYEPNGEGLREAIKNGDTAAVKKLLSEGVDANYRDKQGLSLLHLAALFNQTDIVFTLMECGANMDYKNAQGETPLDCAPATLQYKMLKKLEEAAGLH